MLPKIVLGFDFGMKRIGVAVGQLITCTATPLSILKAEQGEPDWKQILNLIEEWHVEACIVGLPLNMDGTEQSMTVHTRRFGEMLMQRFQLPVFFVDERLTTVAARDRMHQETRGAKRFEKADSVSAQLIVESWMMENKS